MQRQRLLLDPAREGIEAVGINDERFFRRFDDPANQAADVVRPAQARADGHDIGGGDQALEHGDRGFQTDQPVGVVR